MKILFLIDSNVLISSYDKTERQYKLSYLLLQQAVKNPAASCGALKVYPELVFMLQFHESNVVHKPRRYNFVASGLVPDVGLISSPTFEGCSFVAHKVRRYIHLFVVEGFILKRTHVACINNKPIRLRRISAFLPLSSLQGYKAKDFYGG